MSTLLSILYLLKYSNTIIFLIVSVTLLSFDTIIYFLLKYSPYKKIKTLHFFAAIIVYISLILIFFLLPFKPDAYSFNWVFAYSGTIFSFYIAKLVFIIGASLALLLKFKKHPLSFLLFSFVFCALIYGMLWGRYSYEVKNFQKRIDNFPSSFNDIRIVQLSDFHLGIYSGKSEKKFQQIIDSVNAQKPDIIIITGDFINCFAQEIEPIIPYLKKLHSTYGTFGVLGNHDYGDYYKWKKPSDKIENQLLLRKLLSQANIRMLYNEHIALIKGNDSLYLAGVENWGKLPYRQEANLNEALKGISAKNNVLLLSHDPAFWTKEVINHPNIKLTFSGHTHGMQIGFRFHGKEWSPFSVGRDLVSGWYNKEDQWIYINKGLGGSLYPGRVGIRPEITVYTLHN